MDYIITAFTLIGTFANALGYRWGFKVWLVTNIYWVLHNAMANDYPQMIIYAVNAVICVIGLKNWKHKEVSQ